LFYDEIKEIKIVGIDIIMFSNGVLDTLILVSTVSISSNVIFKDFIQPGNYGTFLDE